MKLLKEVLLEVKKTEHPFYVYVLYKPNFVPFYVGKARAGERSPNCLNRGKCHHHRIERHEYEARMVKPPASIKGWNKHKVNTIRKIWRNGGQVFYTIDSWHNDELAAYNREKELIAAIGRRIDKTGPLTNLTEGGEKESATIPQETRRQISNSLKGYYANPKNRKANSDRVKKYYEDPDAREQARQNAIKNNAAENLARWRKDNPEELAESRARQTVSHKEWYENNPQEAKALAERRNEKLRSDDHRQKMSERTRQYNEAHPEEHQKRREKANQSLRKTYAEHNEAKQRCLWLMHDRLVALGEIEPRDKITFKTIANWRKKGLVEKYFPTMSFGNEPTEKWRDFLESLK